jgi:hypothetical protein
MFATQSIIFGEVVKVPHIKTFYHSNEEEGFDYGK